MRRFSQPRRLAAEALGTAFLVVAVVGSGIMAQGLTGDVALALLANTVATAAALIALISVLGPISGAHFNPVVSLVTALGKDMPAREMAGYVAAQFAGGFAGTLVAHAMSGRTILDVSQKVRDGGGQWLSEGVATFGLVFVVLVGRRFARDSVPWLVGLYIASAYWFTASTSFANPAVTVARAFSDTFAGIRPLDTPGFVAAQLFGAVAAFGLCLWLLREEDEHHDLPQS